MGLKTTITYNRILFLIPALRALTDIDLSALGKPYIVI